MAKNKIIAWWSAGITYFFATNRWLIDNVESFGGWEEEDVKAFAISLFATKNVVRCDNNGEEVVVKVAESKTS